jgi:protein-disulfide isomerase
MTGNSSGGSLAAAIILGAAVIVGSLFVKAGLDHHTAALKGVQGVLADLDDTMRTASGIGKKRAQAAADQGAPEQRQEIPIGDSPVRGGANAKVTIVEFMDFECPFCARVRPTIDQILKTYGDQVRVVFKHYPLPIHPQAPGAAQAAEAAHAQGKFWEMHDLLFENQRQLGDAQYDAWAKEIGLDVARFDHDRASKDVKDRIDRDEKEGDQVGVSGTPAFYINGRYLSGAQPFAAFKRMIDQELGKG